MNEKEQINTLHQACICLVGEPLLVIKAIKLITQVIESLECSKKKDERVQANRDLNLKIQFEESEQERKKFLKTRSKNGREA